MNSSNEPGDLTAASHPVNHDGNFMIVVIAFLVGIVVFLGSGLLLVTTTGPWLLPR